MRDRIDVLSDEVEGNEGGVINYLEIELIYYQMRLKAMKKMLLTIYWETMTLILY